jgi:hypothetical protein
MKVMHLPSHCDYLATHIGLSLPVRTVCGVRLKAGEGAPRNAPDGPTPTAPTANHAHVAARERGHRSA